MKPGDRIRVETGETAYEGIFLKRPELFGDDFLVMKLDNGYNIGIDRKKIRSRKVLEGYKPGIKKTMDIRSIKGLPRIAILHTGGTIASKVDYRTGGVVAAFTPEELLSMFPELKGKANIESELIANMWSDDLRFAHFGMIAEAIRKKVRSGADGIIVPIGTDNLAVAAAALSFMIEETPVPILLVGAQRSSDRGSSDAAMNLICAAEFIARTDFKGVAICMHHSTGDGACAILPPAKTRKLHSSRRDAFRAVNDTPYAIMKYPAMKIKVLKDFPKGSDKLVIKPKMEERVGLVKVTVNMFPEQFSFFKGWKGLIIEGTGLGHTPGHVPDDLAAVHKKIFPAIKEVIDSGCIVVMTTGCIFGRVNMNVYDKARDLQELGVISGEDMLSETALVKLSWLLANYREEVKDLVRKNLRGEINPRIQESEFL